MSQQIEIEFKNLLTKNEYDMLLAHFHIEPQQIIRQVNHYFDTPTMQLKQLASGLRIRELPDINECTLKEKASAHRHLETTDVLTANQAAAIFSGEAFTAPNVAARLQALAVPIQQLAVFGTLTTDRVEIPYEGGLLVLDHSFYLHCDDYEVEYETTNETVGQQIFDQFLQQFHIQKQVAPKKIARFMHALQQEG